jgi:amino acid transporter
LKKKRLTLLSLSATTFFIVSGGPYGLEEIVLGHGYARTLLLLVTLPIVWSLPVALMVGELGSALPETGGYYAWVKRGLGPFWGLQEAWLSIAYTLFDMAIYPTLFVTYLARVWPRLLDTSIGKPGWFVGVAMIAACAAWNLRGTRAVGVGAEWLGAILLAPFAVIVALAGWRVAHEGSARAIGLLFAPPPTEDGGASPWIAGLIVCMWNYMGWDNASTIAGEVDDPQKNYPRAMLVTLAIITACYVLPTIAAASTGLLPAEWTAGSWVEVARRLGGTTLAWVVVAGGAISAFGMFNALVLSSTRLPVAMASDGWLPRSLAARSPRTEAPTRAVLLAVTLYAVCLGLGLRRLMEIDVMLYGAGLVLEFAALVALRVREPNLARPFRVPFGVVGAALVGVPPTLLLCIALWAGRHEEGMFGVGSIPIAIALALLGPIWWLASSKRRTHV